MEDCNYENVDVFNILQPFIEHNRNLRCIRIWECLSVTKVLPSFISTLRYLQMTKLNRIDLSGNSIGDKGVADLIHSLNTMTVLHHLLDLGVQGCKALAALLKNSASRIYFLAL